MKINFPINKQNNIKKLLALELIFSVILAFLLKIKLELALVYQVSILFNLAILKLIAILYKRTSNLFCKIIFIYLVGIFSSSFIIGFTMLKTHSNTIMWNGVTSYFILLTAPLIFLIIGVFKEYFNQNNYSLCISKSSFKLIKSDIYYFVLGVLLTYLCTHMIGLNTNIKYLTSKTFVIIFLIKLFTTATIEEIIFRGAIINMLLEVTSSIANNYLKKILIISLSSLIFILSHNFNQLTNPRWLVSILLMSLYFSYYRFKRNSIVFPIILHGLFNALVSY